MVSTRLDGSNGRNDMNLREQFDRDQKGYASFQEYCRALVDKPTPTLSAVAMCVEVRDALIKEYKKVGLM